jgi:hypothetical protein
MLSACAPTSQSEPHSSDHVQEGEVMSGNLFTEAPDGLMAPMSADPADSPALRERMVHVNVAALKEAAFRAMSQPTQVQANLFEGTEFQIALEEVDFVSPENLVITGRVAREPNSAVSLVIKDGVLVGNIHPGDKAEVFEIRAVSGQLHSIREVTPDQHAECETADGGQHAEHGLAPFDASTEENDDADVIASPMDTHRIDVLVAYTPEAEAKHGKSGIQALIQVGIADTNRAFRDSGVKARVRLVKTMKLQQRESGDFFRDLEALKGTRDGRWDEVHAARRKVGADQVSLVGAYRYNNSTAGIGYFNSRYETAFTVTRTSAFSQYTFSHEIGHNLGLDHGDGYVSGQGRFRTIIAYGSYPRIRRFSNPKLRYNSYLTGDRSSNEAGILNRNAAKIAALAKSQN